MYVNLFIAPVPDANRDAYLEHCAAFGEIIREHGCLRYVECWEEDVADGDLTSFLKAVDKPHARRLLTAAALTYVSASLMSLLNIARWFAILRR